MRKKVILLLLSFVALFEVRSALADQNMPDRIYVALTTYHAGIDPNLVGLEHFNEFNPGLAVVWEKRALGLDYGIGLFKNSFGDPSAFLSIGYMHQIKDDLEVGAVLNIADYGSASQFIQTRIGNTSLIAIPAAQVRFKNTFIQIIPETKGAIAMFGLTFSIE